MKRILFVIMITGLFTFCAFAQGASDGGRGNAKTGGGETGGKGKYKYSLPKVCFNKSGGETGGIGKGKQHQFAILGGGDSAGTRKKFFV